MKKVLLIALSFLLAFYICACGGNSENGSAATTNTATVTEAKTEANTTVNATEVELTVENIEEYLSFEVSKEFSDVNPDSADHILIISPLVEGDYSGVAITVEIPLYDHWYNQYTTEIDLEAKVNLTKVGKATVKHPIFFDVADLYETRGAQNDNDPTYIIKSVSGTVK